MVLRFIATTLALAVATFIVPGVHLTSRDVPTDIVALVAVAVIFGLVNAAVKPLFSRFGMTPVGLVVLAAALLVVNAVLLLVVSKICEVTHLAWTVGSFPSALGAALVVSFVSFLVNSLFGSRGEEHR